MATTPAIHGIELPDSLCCCVLPAEEVAGLLAAGLFAALEDELFAGEAADGLAFAEGAVPPLPFAAVNLNVPETGWPSSEVTRQTTV